MNSSASPRSPGSSADEIKGVVARHRVNDQPPLVVLEYLTSPSQGELRLTAEEEAVWTTERADAAVYDWPRAEELAKQHGGYPIIRAAEEQVPCSRRAHKPSPSDVYEALERRRLA